jgi:hypothetical protein
MSSFTENRLNRWLSLVAALAVIAAAAVQCAR